MSLLNAASQLTNNPKLLLLEQYAGEETSRYRPFVIPENDSASRSQSLLAMARLLGRTELRDDFEKLFKQQRLHVNSQGVIRFFSDRNGGQHTEYIPDSTGRYQQRRTGAKAPFHTNIKGAREIELYSDPRTFLAHRPKALEKEQRPRGGVLALLEPDIEAVHRAIAPESKLARVYLIGSEDARNDSSFLKFSEELKESLNPFSIDLTLSWEPIDMGRQGREQRAGLDHSRGRDLTI